MCKEKALEHVLKECSWATKWYLKRIMRRIEALNKVLNIGVIV